MEVGEFGWIVDEEHAGARAAGMKSLTRPKVAMAYSLSTEFMLMDGSCVLCRSTEVETSSENAIISLSCKTCGNYRYVSGCEEELRVLPNDKRRRISALLFERSAASSSRGLILGLHVATRSQDAEQLMRSNIPSREVNAWICEDWPRTHRERINRTLINLARLYDAGHPFVPPDYGSACYLSRNNQEAQFIWHSLVEMDLLAKHGTDSIGHSYSLNHRAWNLVDELLATRRDQRLPAFVAMWFGGKDQRDAMLERYSLGILAGVAAAGYQCRRSDTVEHNEYIMDKIIADIRVAPFVVADISVQNAGVYYEAGFAKGLNIPVVYICEENTSRRDDPVHFDLAQVSQVRFSDNSELCDRLAARILATMGPGPNWTP